MKTYRITTKARPGDKHPSEGESLFGYFHMFLMDDSAANAADRARIIFKQLPYVALTDQAIAYIDTDATVLAEKATRPWLPIGLWGAQKFGFSFYFEFWSESEFNIAEFVESPFPGASSS